MIFESLAFFDTYHFYPLSSSIDKILKNTNNRDFINMVHSSMKAIVTTDNGGYDKLIYKDVPMPKIEQGEVLIKVLAAGVNNTEINTTQDMIDITARHIQIRVLCAPT
jgi:hypothetical protein